MRDNPYTAVIIAASRRSGHAADARAGFSAVIRSAYPSSSRDAGLVPDLTCWIHRVRSSVQVALQDFEQRFGYPPDHNVLMDAATRGGSAMAEALRSRVSVPSAVVEFFDLVEELSLPDVWNGYFLGPASRVTATYVDESPRWLAASDGSVREVLVIGSDGGGALYWLS